MERPQSDSCFKAPFFRMSNHVHKHAENGIVLGIKFRPSLTRDIAALYGELKPDLGLGRLAFTVAKFTDPGGLITPLSPCLAYVGADRTGRSSNLVCQRISFFLGETLGQLKNPHRGGKRPPINLQIRVPPNRLLSLIILATLIISHGEFPFIRSPVSPSLCLSVSLSLCLSVYLLSSHFLFSSFSRSMKRRSQRRLSRRWLSA